MNDGYMELFGAIYRYGITDDTAAVGQLAIKPIGEIFRLKGSPRYHSKAPKTLTPYHAKAKRYIKRNKEYIKSQVSEYIAKEATMWGSTQTRQMQADGIDAVVDKLVEKCKEENNAR